MTGELVPLAPGSLTIAGLSELALPATIARGGERAASRYVEFFTANIRNANTRAAYARSASDFFAWCNRLGLALPAIGPVHVATWIEELKRAGRSAPTIKQQQAGVRMLFDWLVIGQVVPHNPASAVRGPKHSMGKGKTDMPSREEQRRCWRRSTSTS